MPVRRMAVATLALIGIFVAAYLSMYHLGMVHLACGVDGGCETVNTSRYAAIGRVPVAFFGLAFYLAAFAVAMASLQPPLAGSRGPSRLLAVMAGIGVLFSAWLTYLELFVIHAICRWCVGSAVIVTLIFVISLLDLRERPPQSA